MDFIHFLKSLSAEEWMAQATPKWTVKDVVAHLVGWEREAVRTFTEAWQKGEKPWFMIADQYDDFNDRVVEEYKSYSPENLIKEWQKWQNNLNKQVKEVGEDKVYQRYKEFGWVSGDGKESHYEHHLKQIKKALNR